MRYCGAETGIECVIITVVPRTVTNDEQEREDGFVSYSYGSGEGVPITCRVGRIGLTMLDPATGLDIRQHVATRYRLT